MSRTNKSWERVTERRQRKETRVNDNQFDFMPERLIVKVIYLIQRIIDRYQMKKKKDFCTFQLLRNLHLIWI
jgi:hypothetical protein